MTEMLIKSLKDGSEMIYELIDSFYREETQAKIRKAIEGRKT